MTTLPSDEVRNAIARRQTEAAPNEGALEVIRAKAREAKQLEMRIAELTETLKAHKQTLKTILESTLPELMIAAGTDTVGVVPEGNLPGYDLEMKTVYSARINKEDPEETRVAAFKALEGAGASDLIKTEVAVFFPKKEYAKTKAFLAYLEDKGLPFETKSEVHWATLTKWFSERVQKTGTMPEFAELIHGYVGKAVVIKERA